MKLLGKLALAAGIAGAAATIYAAPGSEASYSEATARAMSIHETMQADFHHVLELQVRARKEKDVIKLNCVNDKLVEIKPQMNIADRLQLELEGARESEDGSAIVGISQAADTVHHLREAADQCIGEHSLVGESSNEFTHPPIPDNPDSDTWAPAVEPPAYASPFN
jgi:hypothetical protein